ncbi:hypothetical protein [Sphingomonas oryzagri]
MSRTAFVACLALAAASPAWAAPESPAMPTFRDIEYRYTDLEALDAGRDAIRHAIPVGTSVALAQQILGKAGARCKPMKHDPQTTRCIYNELNIVDDVAAEIRWKTLLHTADDRITDVSVDREIDRKGNAD